MLLLRLSLSFFTDRNQSGSGSSLGTTVFFPFVFTCNVTFSSKLFQPSLKMIIYLFTYLFSFGCGLHCCVELCLPVASRGNSLVAVGRLLTTEAFLVVGHGL